MTPTLALSSKDRAGVLRSLGTPAMPPGLQLALADRCRALLEAFDGASARDELPHLMASVDEAVGSSPDRLWLARAVIGADLPTDVEMQEILAAFTLDGLWFSLQPTLERLRTYKKHARVTIARGAVTMDVSDTATSTYLTGVQRVVLECCKRWMAQDREALYLGWSSAENHLRRLTREELAWLRGDKLIEVEPDLGVSDVVVPWQGKHVIPELSARPLRTARLLPLNRYSGGEVAYVGFDCVPIMASATVGQGMTSNFSGNLAAVRHADRVATISHATAVEYRGWRAMCHGRGAAGPEVVAVPLPVEAPNPSAADLDTARRMLTLPDHPTVLVVGSHEPRKNHLAILHAADLLWREGVQFTLTIVGGGSWNAEDYERVVAELTITGRPLLSLRALPDQLLWAAYQIADVVVFPSLHEGFGLPVAEALAAGTPVITSDFGSMREIVAPDGEPLGGLLVNPRDDHAIAEAMRIMLTDKATASRLAAETRQRPARTWDDYANELWAYLVEGQPPG